MAHDATYVAASVLWIELLFIWLWSIRLTLHDSTLPKVHRTWLLEAVVGSILSTAIIVMAILMVGVAPFVVTDKVASFQERGRTSIQGRQLPNGDGSVQIVGTLYSKGKPVGNRRLAFMFDSGFISRDIITDESGAFALKLPPGEWTLLAPHVYDTNGDIKFQIEPRIVDWPLRFVVDGGPVRTTYTLEVQVD